ncbi:TetR/AcrR family transcriptional regulator [Nocardia sp. CDC160]|uniref:TetR/AcrR family transcriptional regulator n=1 Tax=Nocardia sp. CDC160 TaxID=3112166 RepID=UPI002DBE8BB4|nr:TetR/AcrR family transcriptional regulator [Nocardia sp. CDC160]MEC3914643.1 TetR/AcrR family transcriptional regulator [Nocardia sp. CDC160]
MPVTTGNSKRDKSGAPKAKPETPATKAEAKPGRSRAEQREDTRLAILDATIASLIENGHAATTTRGVAERAGVSQGAVQHYYPTRAELLDAAIRRVADITAQAVIETYSTTTGSERERVAVLVDELWTLAQVAPVSVGFEFLAAARTDPEMSTTVAHLVQHIEETVFTVARRVLGDLAERPGARDWMRITVITIAGVLLTASVPAATALVPDWPTVRHHIMTSFDTWRAEGS